MNRRDKQFLDRLEPLLREIYGTGWDYDFDVEPDGIYLRLNVWGSCNTCAGDGEWESTTEDSPDELVSLGRCPDCEVTA